MISPPSKFSSPDCTDVRELAVQIYDIYYLMQNYFGCANFAHTLAPVLVILVFSVLVMEPLGNGLGVLF